MSSDNDVEKDHHPWWEIPVVAVAKVLMGPFLITTWERWNQPNVDEILAFVLGCLVWAQAMEWVVSLL